MADDEALDGFLMPPSRIAEARRNRSLEIEQSPLVEEYRELLRAADDHAAAEKVRLAMAEKISSR